MDTNRDQEHDWQAVQESSWAGVEFHANAQELRGHLLLDEFGREGRGSELPARMNDERVLEYKHGCFFHAHAFLNLEF